MNEGEIMHAALTEIADQDDGIMRDRPDDPVLIARMALSKVEELRAGIENECRRIRS